jgi:decaprenylphospho-beta-D-erythro-pentofuranosid-2-ulose 2-reductase
MNNSYVIFGGSSGVGRALAELMAQNGESLILISRDLRDLIPLKSDYEIRYKVRVQIYEYDLNSDNQQIKSNLLLFFSDNINSISGIYYLAGEISDSDEINLNIIEVDKIIKINFLSIFKLNNDIMKLLDLNKEITIVFFSSIAAQRARVKNIYYSLAKHALEFYVSGLRLNLTINNYKWLIQNYILGYINTNLSFSQSTIIPCANTRVIAKTIYKNRKINFGTMYLPQYWYIIMLIFRNIPWSIFKKLKF